MLAVCLFLFQNWKQFQLQVSCHSRLFYSKNYLVQFHTQFVEDTKYAYVDRRLCILSPLMETLSYWKACKKAQTLLGLFQSEALIYANPNDNVSKKYIYLTFFLYLVCGQGILVPNSSSLKCFLVAHFLSIDLYLEVFRSLMCHNNS